MVSIASRDGMTILSANLEGYDGPEDDYNFPGGSVIMQGAFNGPKYYAGAEDADGTINTDADIITGEEGLLTNSTPVLPAEIRILIRSYTQNCMQNLLKNRQMEKNYPIIPM